MTLTTERLLLRPWKTTDLVSFAKLNADPMVMRHFPSTLDAEASDAVASRIMKHFEDYGYGFWAVEVIDEADFIGFVGLNNCSPPLPFAPAVEIGWRLAAAYHGLGYATEAAQAALAYGFETLNLHEIVAYTTTENAASRNVMRKLEMHHDTRDDFDHPRLAEHHPQRRHVLYRIRRAS